MQVPSPPRFIQCLQYPLIHHIDLSPDTRQLAYTTYKPSRRRIYICGIPPDILAKLQPGQEVHVQLPVPIAAQQLGRSPSTHQRDSFVIRYFRKLLSRKNVIPAIAVKPCDPLDCPATSPRVSGKSSSVQTTDLMDHHSGANPGDMLPISQSANRSYSSISRLRHLFNWRPARHALPPIIDVPLTQGQKRNAAAGAPERDGRYIREKISVPVQLHQFPPFNTHPLWTMELGVAACAFVFKELDC